jgi:hypothetical protein
MRRTQDRNVVWLKLMVGRLTSSTQSFRHILRRKRICVARGRHNPHTAVFIDGACIPAFVVMLLEPQAGCFMRWMIGVQQRDEHIHIQKRDHSVAISLTKLVDEFIGNDPSSMGERGDAAKRDWGLIFRDLWWRSGHSQCAPQQVREQLTCRLAFPTAKLLQRQIDVVVDIESRPHAQSIFQQAVRCKRAKKGVQRRG